jgi:hypothetical protein
MRIVRMAVATALLGLTVMVPAPGQAAPPPMSTPGDVSRISLVAAATSDGWTYQQFRNSAYPCSISGYQTFTIATKTGSSPTARLTLWTFLHGGGTGYFKPNGQPTSTAHMTEEPLARQQESLKTGALNSRIAASTPAIRLMSVSMCNRDIYGGFGLADPNNPNTTPDGQPRYTNGLLATKAAVQFATSRYPTNDYFLYGTSAGSYGSYHVAFGLQQQGFPPTGIVTDSGLMNTPWQEVNRYQPACGHTDEWASIYPRRLHPFIVTGTNDPDQLVTQRRLTVPVMDVFSIGDPGQCGMLQISCPLRDGTTRPMGSVDCMHEPLRRAIAAQGASSKSYSMRLCVTIAGSGRECGVHTPTGDPGMVNTLAPEPADFNGKILRWVQLRGTDDAD